MAPIGFALHVLEAIGVLILTVAAGPPMLRWLTRQPTPTARNPEPMSREERWLWVILAAVGLFILSVVIILVEMFIGAL